MNKCLTVVVMTIGLFLSHVACADNASEVKNLFERYIAARNSRDADGLKALVLDSSNMFVGLVGGAPAWGRDAFLQKALDPQCHGKFYLDPGLPDLRMIELSGDVVEIYVPVAFAPAPVLQPGQQVQFSQQPPQKWMINQVVVKTADGWRIVPGTAFKLSGLGGQLFC
jgi:hypothetical protein